MDAIPIKKFDGKNLMTDGHTRVVLACMNGLEVVPYYLDEDELDMAAYATDVQVCDDEDVNDMASLAKRIVPYKDYEVLWRKRCMELYRGEEYAKNKEKLDKEICQC